MTNNICPSCNAPIDEGAKFCPNCGKTIASAGQEMSGWTILGIAAIVIGLVFAIACPLVQKNNYHSSLSGYGDLSYRLAAHDKPGEGATVFAVLACLIGIPAIIWLAKRKPSTGSNASETQAGQPPQGNRPTPFASASTYSQAAAPANIPFPRQSSPEVDALLRRAFIVLGDGDWQKADDLLEQALNRDPESAKAYFGKTWVRLQISSEAMLREMLSAQGINLLLEDKDFQKAVQYADYGYLSALTSYHPELQRIGIYLGASVAMESATSAEQFDFLADKFDSISEYENSFALAVHCRDEAKSHRAREVEEMEKEGIYQGAVEAMKTAKTARQFEVLADTFSKVKGLRNAVVLAEECRRKAKTYNKIENMIEWVLIALIPIPIIWLVIYLIGFF